MLGGSVEVDALPSIPNYILDFNFDEPTSHPTGPSHEGHREAGELVRSASFTSIAGLSSPSQGIKRTFSENVLGTLGQNQATVTPSMQNANNELFRRASQKADRRMSSTKFGIAKEVVEEIKAVDQDQGKVSSRSVTGTIRNIARKSWLPGSRPSSPQRKDQAKLVKKPSMTSIKSERSSDKSFTLIEPIAAPTPHKTNAGPPKIEEFAFADEDFAPTASSYTVSEISVDPDSETSSKRLSRQSSATSLKSKASNDRMYLTVHSQVPPVPKSVSPDRSSNLSVEAGKKKDPLWSNFRAIDGEYSMFHSKTSLQKAKVIRSTLLPFLTKHALDSSTLALRVEDLDRRTVILNRWWTGLIELLNGSHNQSISGTDRPAFLEAITELMMRPEWRVPPFPANPTDSPRKRPNMIKTTSKMSIESDDSDFLVSSIHQNIRNTFVQNLLLQLAFVVEKLSMRSAPASLVTFGGKTCAYAFFFCPGVADTLCRLWNIPAGTLRRVFFEYGGDRGSRSTFVSQELASSFPPPVRSLSLSSQGELARHIQHKAQVPPGTSNIRWYGPWVNRWIGRDSDLFFVFVKHYHLLVTRFVLKPLSLEERIFVPGFLPVHAQILMVLESTLYRHAGHFAAENYVPTHPGDMPDTMAPLPLLTPNATRSIVENRLVMLMRDLINDSQTEHEQLVALLVGSFHYVLKAATRKVSMYNNDACFVLCDFLEELWPMFSKYYQFHSGTEDWPFWSHVLKQMMQSQTTMTQIRVIAFLYSMWAILMSNAERKREMVLGWLLEPTFFDQVFNHWSPMVRHYYSRLMCWRVARCDGSASEIDLEILHTLSSRLKKCWSHHQYLCAESEMRETAPPLSHPCVPAPGRVFLIIRTDSQPISNSPFSSFEKLLQSGDNTTYSNPPPTFNKVSDVDTSQSNLKKRWSILRGINLFSGPGTGRPGEVTPPNSPDAQLANSKSRQLGGKRSNPPSRPVTPPHQPLAFKFSLEFAANKAAQSFNERRLPVPVLPQNAQKLLDELELSNRIKCVDLPPLAEAKPLKPHARELNTAKYSGRALAEWNQVVNECRNFYARRKLEGCPKDDLVETPTMAVETFRMFG